MKKTPLVRLPHGAQTLENELIVNYLINDEVFKRSMENDLGKVIRIWPDWSRDALVYELLDGTTFESVLSKLIKEMKRIGYMKEFEH
jgi:hypothetical protein